MNSQSSRRSFLRQAGAWLAGVSALRAAAPRPNVIVILADDLGYGDLACYNRESRIPTPNLDRMATQGVRFTDAHTPSAVCTPTRYGLLTGRYCWRTSLKEGVLDGIDPPLIEAGRMTIASMLKRQGYATACVGKWHLGMQWTGKDGKPVAARGSSAGGFRDGRDIDYTKPVGVGPNDAGFDYYFGISASLDMSPYCFIENKRTVGVPDVPSADSRSLFLNQVPGVTTKGFDLHDVLPACTKKAAEFIARQTARQPFFLYLPLPAPHLPVVPNKEYIGRSRAGLYGDFVAEMDASVGTVFDALDKRGLAENTLVIFTSDNGGLWHWWDFKEADDVKFGKITPRGQYEKDFGHRSNGDWRGTKADLWEGGHRVPFIVRWPGRAKSATVCGQSVCLTDVIATCAEICGVPLPVDAAEDSFSMLPLLSDPERAGAVRKDIIYHSLRGEFAIRAGEWKLIERRGSGGFSTPRTIEPKAGGPKGQLYNIVLDPRETRNVYDEHPDVVERLARLLDQYRKQGRSRGA